MNRMLAGLLGVVGVLIVASPGHAMVRPLAAGIVLPEAGVEPVQLRAPIVRGQDRDRRDYRHRDYRHRDYRRHRSYHHRRRSYHDRRR